jgi:probable F420-dependent oxidoreductase
MKFGFYLPTHGPGADRDGIEALVTRGEVLGFDSVMVADHAVFPLEVTSAYPYTLSGAFPGEGDALDQLTLMAFVAAKTSRMRIVSSIMIVPQRNPVLAAKAIATIDVLSRGRVTVGIGVGWLREEFDALDAHHFERRGAVTDEYVRIFKNLWTEDPSAYEGEFYRYDALHCLPKPVQQPHPPIWVGGHSPAALRRVAGLGDGWHPVGVNPAAPIGPEEMREHLERLRELTEQAGRDFDALTTSFKAPLYDATLPVHVGEERRPFTGPPDAIIQDIGALADVGVHEIVIDFRLNTLDQSLERMDEFAETILPAFR